MRVLLCVAAALGLAAGASAQPVDFARDIRPLLSDRCFTCHGPDEAQRQVGLRLDEEAGAKKPRGSRVPIVPGDPLASEVYKRISAPAATLRMPPAASGKKPLTATDVDLVRRWIEQGAKWQ